MYVQQYKEHYEGKIRQEVQFKMCKVSAIPIFLYEALTWVGTKTERDKIQTAEMKYLPTYKNI
jgi:hypothetical protein